MIKNTAISFTFFIYLIFASLNSTFCYAQTVTIGTQVWMTKNLDVDKFRNGDPIPEAKTDEEWYQATNNKEPVWCYYNNDPANGEKYGKLYNWFAVNDPRGLAPTGYHVSSDAEWTTLTNYLGGESVAGTKMKSTSGFSCLLGGFRSNDGTFYNIGSEGYWWSSTEANANYAWYRRLYYDNGSIGRTKLYKEGGVSVRCLKN
jgi:uncharacterized protein (TIGR02145 family)